MFKIFQFVWFGGGRVGWPLPHNWLLLLFCCCCCWVILALTIERILSLLGNFIELQVNNNNHIVEYSSRYQTFVRRCFSSIICGIRLYVYDIIIIISMFYSLLWFVFLEILILFTCQIQRGRHFRMRIGKVPWEPHQTPSLIIPRPLITKSHKELESFNAYVCVCFLLSLYSSLFRFLFHGVVEWVACVTLEFIDFICWFRACDLPNPISGEIVDQPSYSQLIVNV